MRTAQRSQAYGRVVKTLEDLGPSKLLPAETETIREAADALFFTEDVLADAEAQEALATIEALVDHLADSGRWSRERADALLDDVVACGALAVETAE